MEKNETSIKNSQVCFLTNHLKKFNGKNWDLGNKNSRTWGDRLASLLWSISKVLLPGWFTVDPVETESLGTVSPELGDGVVSPGPPEVINTKSSSVQIGPLLIPPHQTSIPQFHLSFSGDMRGWDWGSTATQRREVKEVARSPTTLRVSCFLEESLCPDRYRQFPTWGRRAGLDSSGRGGLPAR